MNLLKFKCNMSYFLVFSRIFFVIFAKYKYY